MAVRRTDFDTTVVVTTIMVSDACFVSPEFACCTNLLSLLYILFRFFSYVANAGVLSNYVTVMLHYQALCLICIFFLLYLSVLSNLLIYFINKNICLPLVLLNYVTIWMNANFRRPSMLRMRPARTQARFAHSLTHTNTYIHIWWTAYSR